MKKLLEGKKIAILATDGVEIAELTEPREALQDAGAKTELISLAYDPIRGWWHKNWGGTFPVEKTVFLAQADDYDALFLPGGIINADILRMDKDAVALVEDFIRQGKPIAAICHAPWLLIEADAVIGRKVTSWFSLQTDLLNAGAHWENAEVVVDDDLVTSRQPDDIPLFNKQMVETFARYIAPTQIPVLSTI